MRVGVRVQKVCNGPSYGPSPYTRLDPDNVTFMIGRREVQFSYFDVVLLTGLPATGREVMFHRGDGAGKVERLVMAAMEESLERERQWWRGDRTDNRIYRNYVTIMIELCRHNTTQRRVFRCFRSCFCCWL